MNRDMHAPRRPRFSWTAARHVFPISLGLFAAFCSPVWGRPDAVDTAKSAASHQGDRRAPVEVNLGARAFGDPFYLRADTLSFGYVAADGFAVPGEVWTFDHGAADPFEGWYSMDMTIESSLHVRHLTESHWQSDPGNVVPAPGSHRSSRYV